jgi:hypothetical protein
MIRAPNEGIESKKEIAARQGGSGGDLGKGEANSRGGIVT